MQFFTFDIEWDFPGTEIGVFFKIVLFNIVFFNVVFFFFQRVTKIGAIELFGLSIVTIFNDWIIV